MTLTAFDSHVLGRVKSEIRDEIAERSRTILAGNIKDMEDYKRLIGYCAGLQRALEIMDAVVDPPKPPKPLIRNIG